MLLIILEGGVGDLAGGFRFRTNDEAGTAGTAYARGQFRRDDENRTSYQLGSVYVSVPGVYQIPTARLEQKDQVKVREPAFRLNLNQKMDLADLQDMVVGHKDGHTIGQ